MTVSAALPALVADIGGTNTRIALAHGVTVDESTVRRFRNADQTGLEEIIRAFLQDLGQPDTGAACVALAGPVSGDTGRMTNLDWEISTELLKRAAGAPKAALLNDLQAQGHALAHLDDAKCPVLFAAEKTRPSGSKLVAGVGTGFNIAPVYPAAAGTEVLASETGHTDLPVADEATLSLSRHIAARHGHAALEEVLSGRGLEATYAWAAAEAGQKMTLSAAEIMTAAKAGSDPLATRTLQVFSATLGRTCSNLALTCLPYGGIYFSGGVARAAAPLLESHGFYTAFLDKGRFSDFLRQFPVHVIEDDYAALTGCASFLAAR
jgi:glucokinase